MNMEIFEVAGLVADYYLKENLTKDSWLINWGKDGKQHWFYSD